MEEIALQALGLGKQFRVQLALVREIGTQALDLENGRMVAAGEHAAVTAADERRGP